MRIKYALVALAGLFLGSVAGGVGVAWFCTDMTAHMIGAAWRDGSLHSLGDTTLYLHLLEEGRTESLQKLLVGRLQASTISLAAGAADGDGNARLLRKQIELAGQIKSIQADDSDIGRMAADARKRILEEID